MRLLIVDDEELPRCVVREYLAGEAGVEIAGECADGFAAVKACGELRPDVLILDVQMPKLNGFEVLELLDPAPAVIFTTAYDQYALRAFDAHAVDYLLKPFSRERLLTAIDRVRGRLRAPAPAPAELNAAVHGPERPLARIVVRDGAKISLIPIDELLAAEAQDDYVALHTATKSYLKKQTLASLEAALDLARFARVHRGWIVNLAAISRLEPYGRDSFIAILQNGRKIPVSRSGHARLRELFT